MKVLLEDRRDRAFQFSIGIQKRSQGIREILERILNRVSFGYQFRQQRACECITSLRLGIQHQREFIKGFPF